MPEIYRDPAAAEQSIFVNPVGLSIDINSFDWFNINGAKQSFGALPATVVAPSATTYYQLDSLTGVMSTNTTGFSAGSVPVGTITSDATSIIDIDIYEDRPNPYEKSFKDDGNSLIQDQLDGTAKIISFDFYRPDNHILTSFQGLAVYTLTPNTVNYIEIDANNGLTSHLGGYTGVDFEFAIVTTNAANEIINIEYNADLFTETPDTDVTTLGVGSPLSAIKEDLTFDVEATLFTNTLLASVTSAPALSIDPVDGAITYVSWDDSGNVVHQTGSYHTGAYTPVGLVITDVSGRIVEIWDATDVITGILDPRTIDYDNTNYNNLVTGSELSPELIDSDPVNGTDTYYELTAANVWNSVTSGPFTNGSTPALLARVSASGEIGRVFNFLVDPLAPVIPGAIASVFDVSSHNYVDSTGTTKLFLGASAVDPVDNDTNYVSVTDAGVLNVNVGGFPTNETPVAIVYTDALGNITDIINASVDHDPSLTIDFPATAYTDGLGTSNLSDELLNFDPDDNTITYIEIATDGMWMDSPTGFTPGSTPVAVVKTDAAGNIIRITNITPTREEEQLVIDHDHLQISMEATDAEVASIYAGMDKVRIQTINGNTYYIVKTQEFVENTTDGIIVVLNEDGSTINGTFTVNKTTKLVTIT